eukprot:GEMP01001900.1.p1 GENE.GEMP01001900.1~~GEMP01001900.1.p1  ORF type:complete len:1255 (+),score=236.17 GEMP01001900.1:458-4222(+)
MATWDITKIYVLRVPIYLDPDGSLRVELAICKGRHKRAPCWKMWKKKLKVKAETLNVPVGEARWEDPVLPIVSFRVASPKTVSVKANLIYSNSQMKEVLCSFVGTLREGENIFQRNYDGVLCGSELRIFVASTGKNRPVCLQNCVPRDTVSISGFLTSVAWNEWTQDLSKVWKPAWPCNDDELPVGYELAALVEQELKDDCIIFFNTLFPRIRSSVYRQIIHFYDRSQKSANSVMQSQSFAKFSKHIPYAQSLGTSYITNSNSSNEDDDEMERNPIVENRKRIQFLKRLFLLVGFAGVTLHRYEDDPGILWPYPIASVFGHGGRLLVRLEDVHPAQFLHFLITGTLTTAGCSSSSACYSLAPFKRRIAATHQVELDSKTGNLTERKLSVTNLQEVVTNVSDGIQGRHLGLDIPLGGTGNTAAVPGGKHYVGLMGEPIQDSRASGGSFEVSQSMQLGHVYVRIDDFGEIAQAVSPKRHNSSSSVGKTEDSPDASTTDATGSSGSPISRGSRARPKHQRARLRSDPLLRVCRSVAELEWLRDASTPGNTLPPPPTAAALRCLVEFKLKSDAFRWYELEGSIEKAVDKLYSDLCSDGVGFLLANRDGRLVLLSRRAIAWVECAGKILCASKSATATQKTSAGSNVEVSAQEGSDAQSYVPAVNAVAEKSGGKNLDPTWLEKRLSCKMVKLGERPAQSKRATIRQLFRKNSQMPNDRDVDAKEQQDKSLFKALKICISGESSADKVKHEVSLSTGIPEKDLEIDQVVVVEDDDVPSEYPGLVMKEEVTLFAFLTRASSLSAIPFEFTCIKMAGSHPLEVEKVMFDKRAARQWAESLPDNCENISPPSWHALSILLNASDAMVPTVKRLYEQLQHSSNVLKRKNKKLTLYRKVMYVRLRYEGYVLVESPPFANETDRNPSLNSLIFVESRSDTIAYVHIDALEATAKRLNMSLDVLEASIQQTSRDPIPLEDVESRLIFSDFGKTQTVTKVVTSCVVTYEIIDQAPFRHLGLPVATSAAAHAALDQPCIVKQTTPFGIHAQKFQWVGEELYCDSVVGFPKRQKITTPMGGRRRVLCAEEQEELQQAFQKRRVASLLIGIEGCAPGKKNPLCGESHDASGKSSRMSACGNRKWRAYKLNSLMDPFPSAANGIRMTCRPKLFKDFQVACELLINSTEEEPNITRASTMVDLLNMSLRPRRRSEINKGEDVREMFRAILCDNALGAKAVIDAAIHDKKTKAELPMTQLQRVGTSTRRKSSIL